MRAWGARVPGARACARPEAAYQRSWFGLLRTSFGRPARQREKHFVQAGRSYRELRQLNPVVIERAQHGCGLRRPRESCGEDRGVAGFEHAIAEYTHYDLMRESALLRGREPHV